MKLRLLLFLSLSVLTALSPPACAQVRSLTLGINVNSPYGIGEPWVTIREGLQRLDFVESISAQPDKDASTGELRTKNGQLPDLEVLAKALRDTGAGASLRGVEATIDGEIAKEDDHFVLRLSGTNLTLDLKPLTKLVQRRRQPTAAEKAAYQTLTAKSKAHSLRARVVGPLVREVAGREASRPPALEVRTFSLLTDKQNTGKEK